ncbi:unnamed protein product [Urochloa humidicola]
MRTRAAAASLPCRSSRRTCGWLPLPFSPRNKDAKPILIKVRDTKHETSHEASGGKAQSYGTGTLQALSHRSTACYGMPGAPQLHASGRRV